MRDFRTKATKLANPIPAELIDKNPTSPGMKLCTGCASMLGFKHFDLDASKNDGMRSRCKRCRAEGARDAHREDIANKAMELDRRAADIITATTESGGSAIPHVAELFHHLVEVFGGPEGLAQHCLSTYLMAKPGSANRQRTIGMIMQMGAKVTETGAANVPLDLLSNEDIERELENRMRVISINSQKKIESA